MNTNITFEEQIRKLISDAQDELNDIEKSIKERENRRSALAEELHSYETSLKSYLRRIGQEPEQEITNWGNILGRCKTHRERLIAIAKRNGGELRLSPTVDILYSGKYIKSKVRANAYLIVHRIVTEMMGKGEFIRVGKGIYRIPPNARLL